MKAFPKEIFVIRDDSYLIVRENGLSDVGFEANTPCAIYRLVEVGQVKVERKYESRGGKKS